MTKVDNQLYYAYIQFDSLNAMEWTLKQIEQIGKIHRIDFASKGILVRKKPKLRGFDKILPEISEIVPSKEVKE